jgi:sulfoxide reductase heme-binding subunit YedZ
VAAVGLTFRSGVVKTSKVVLFLAALVPQALLVHGALTNDLGANPAETIQLTTGRWAFRFLLLSLAITPVRRITKWNVLIQYRRMLGLFAFYYASCHLAAYYAFDLNFSVAAVVGDTLKRPFIFMGMAAFLTMLPLALTSTKGWIRRLGKKWTQLHRLVYVSAICAAIHFAWKVKVFTGDPVLYALAVTVLLAFRLIWTLTQSRANALRYRERSVQPSR